MNKKGLETYVLVTTIITVVSLIVVGFALANITGVIPGSITKETCHSSVLIRGLDVKNIPIGKTLSDLKCQTEYKCLTMGGECPKGYEKVSVKNEDDIKRELANSMYDCWWMLGEGKIDVFGASVTPGWEQTCSICSITAFDSEIQTKYPTITGFGDWMINNDIPGKKITYWQYLTNSPAVYNSSITKDDRYETTKRYATTFSFNKASIFSELATATLSCGIGAKLGAPIGGAIGSVVPLAGTGMGLIIGGVGGCVTGFYGGFELQSAWEKLIGQKRDFYASVLFIPFDVESIKQFGCQNIESIP